MSSLENGTLHLVYANLALITVSRIFLFYWMVACEVIKKFLCSCALFMVISFLYAFLMMLLVITLGRCMVQFVINWV